MSSPDAGLLLDAVFTAHVEQYGEPDLHFPFEPLVGSHPLGVFIWRPDDEVPMTTFSTIGMSAARMPGSSHRCEVHFTVRGDLFEEEEAAGASCLAALAAWPYRERRAFDFWHVTPDLGSIPAFSNCSRGIFHPALTPDGWDHTHHEQELIKLLNFIPITAAEFSRLQQNGLEPLLDELYRNQVDIFSNR